MGCWEARSELRLMKAYVKMKVGVSPCKGCTDRHAGCHGKCERYNKWANDRAQAKTDYYSEFADIRNADMSDSIRDRRMQICRKTALGRCTSKERRYFRKNF